MSENTSCGDCGMLVGPAALFHPYMYCQLFKLGVTNPARFLADQYFIPDPDHWGEDARAKQDEAVQMRMLLVPHRQKV